MDARNFTDDSSEETMRAVQEFIAMTDKYIESQAQQQPEQTAELAKISTQEKTVTSDEQSNQAESGWQNKVLHRNILGAVVLSVCALTALSFFAKRNRPIETEIIAQKLAKLNQF